MIARPRVAGWTLLAAACVGGLAACGDPLQPHEAVSDTALAQPFQEGDASAPRDAGDKSHAHLFACQSDADCIAVPRAGLCRNGVKEAVNRHHLGDYREAFAHARHGACTFLLIRDRRVARCDQNAKRCVLLAPPDEPALPAIFPPPEAE